MKRVLAALIVLMILAAIMTGCAGSGEKSVTSELQTEEGEAKMITNQENLKEIWLAGGCFGAWRNIFQESKAYMTWYPDMRTETPQIPRTQM